jgi:putative endopeptidase
MTQDDFSLDTTIRPQDDFFHHVNGSWLKTHPIPESEVRWGTFDVLRDKAREDMRTIYEELQKRNDLTAGSIEQQARDLYFTGMNFDSFEAKHRQLVQNLFKKIDEAKISRDLSGIIGHLHKHDIGGPWYAMVDAANDDSSTHILRFMQSGLTLPNRDYYLDDSPKMEKIRKEYEKYTLATHGYFSELGETAEGFWKTIIDFETEIAKISRTPAALREPENNFHRTALNDVKATYSAIDWDLYAQALGWQADDKISIDQPEFMAFMNESLLKRPPAEWKMYLKWRVLTRSIGKISAKMADHHFSFFGKVLSGAQEIQPLWKRVVGSVGATIGDGTGRLYTEKHFPESSKQKVLELVEEVRSAYAERMDSLDWMSDDTKVYAKKKLAKMKVLIGYPDKWRSFSGLTIERSSHLGNILEAQKFEIAYWLKKLHEPTSRDEWFMTPQTVNAYHDPSRLVICFPAAILQAPFFDPSASRATNLGGIGTVIGHELTHGFDDEGSKFDASGNVKSWQTADEKAAFKEKAQHIIDQADNYEVLPGLNLRGQLVLGESIADLGGVELALHALKKTLAGSEDEQLQALQAFFVNFAHTEAGSIREEKQREYALNDPHPNSEFRVNAMLQHVDDFYKAYAVESGDKLFRGPERRAKIW